MWAGRETPAPYVRVSTREDADRLVADVMETMAQLEKVLEVETAHLRVGRIRDGLAQQERKGELSGAYMLGLEAVKANAVALARFAPAALERLKEAHARFGRAVETNQVVLATARAVSESLVKGVAEEMNRSARPQGYGPAAAAPARPGAGQALLVSREM